MTVHDALEARRSIDLGRTTETLLAALPVDRPVTITPEALEAAAAGDVTLLTLLFAEEVEPEPDELAAIAEISDEREPTLTTEALRRELGISSR